jgi:hypothetical protein
MLVDGVGHFQTIDQRGVQLLTSLVANEIDQVRPHRLQISSPELIAIGVVGRFDLLFSRGRIRELISISIISSGDFPFLASAAISRELIRASSARCRASFVAAAGSR